MTHQQSFSCRLLRLKEQLGIQHDKDIAVLLGLGVTAFSGRKERGSFPVNHLLALAAKRPDLHIDFTYVLNGEPPISSEISSKNIDINKLSADELELLNIFSQLSLTQKVHLVGFITNQLGVEARV
ncbi:transcriptional regulator [Limnobaculum zhutongyuii]|uniref:Transcriptional regulator n=1 Tax=Limnobaculum zhutongyuii TaxID=2498113 RepID=A0A411WHS2_9GAMM|nr:helix-turn-helix domain-containing protein [Limnobaculum zhutongyuii]QBH95753.1 transcriptional regulator [Limnobaculum zhutongyuii]TQS86136.1 transcriptional regulator [Limnobaculum zhutongyuii]